MRKNHSTCLIGLFKNKERHGIYKCTMSIVGTAISRQTKGKLNSYRKFTLCRGASAKMDSIFHRLTKCQYRSRLRSQPNKQLIACFALYALISVNAHAIVEGGPNDYYSTDRWTRQYLNSVNSLHLVPAEAQVTRGYAAAPGTKTYNIWEEIDFTLRWFPNHPKGLQFMSKWLPKYPHPPDKNVEYYFQKALTYKPAPELRPVDATVRVLYAIYLHKQKKYQQAQEQYESALSIAPNNSEIHYNLGLLLAEKKDYPAALKHAQTAYTLGFPLPGLKNKLKKAGVWKNIPKEKQQP